MINRILYWLITLPVLGKLGVLGTVVLFSCCMLTSIASIPAARARRAANATQVALDTTATTIALTQLTTVALEQQQATKTGIAMSSTQTSVALIEQSTIQALAASAATAEAAVAASTATADALVEATTIAVAFATSEAATVSASATALAAPTSVPVAAETIEYTEYSRNEESGKIWVNIVVPPGTDHETIIQLAQQLREQEVSSSFRIFDDSSQIDAFVNNSIYYADDRYPYPEEWANEHYIALINEQFSGGGRSQWQLAFQDDYTTVDIDVAQTAWGGRRNDGRITSEEADGWERDYFAYAKDLACCVIRVDAAPNSSLEVKITLDGDLATRPEEARRLLASGVFTRYQSKLGECLLTVRFLDTSGSPFPDGYTNTACR